MKYVLTLLIFVFNLLFNFVIAKEKPTIEIIHDPFQTFYPHLGNSICRKKAFEIASDKNIDKKTKIKLWEKYKKTCFHDGSYQFVLADIYLSLGDVNKSKDILEQSIRNDQKYDKKNHKLSLHTIYRLSGEKGKALNLANKMIADYKNWYGGYQALGADNLDMRNYCSAKKYLETALKLNDKDPETYLLLSAVSYELKEDDKVIDYYWKAFILDPIQPFADWRSSAAAVGIYVLRGQFEKAKDILDQQQELFPEIKKDKRFNAVKDFYENALKKSSKQ